LKKEKNLKKLIHSKPKIEKYEKYENYESKRNVKNNLQNLNIKKCVTKILQNLKIFKYLF
jgi:hypothetical protein